ncbi:MAG: hypothetical protein GXP62_08665 [Oligoflexia bacterium]|nr:hypothetical protein [Oligoflexia bacterium]
MFFTLPLTLALLGATACGAKKPPSQPARNVLEAAAPVLPGMVGQVYGRGHSTPGDPVLALAGKDLPLDESLSGAAASLALDEDGAFTIADARWAAWRAGYPFSVRAAVTGSTDLPAAPPELLAGIAQARKAGDDIGLARARAGNQDTWVALFATPLADVPTFSRQYALGQTFSLALPAVATWSIVSPTGERSDGTGPVAFILRSDGEWWLDARLPDGRISLPIYVDMKMPPKPLLSLPGDGSVGPDDAADRTVDLLGQIREAFGVAVLTSDPTLQTLARAPLDQVSAGTWQHDEQVQRLRDAGFMGGSTDQAWCQAQTVALCLDSLLRSADGRTALLAQDHRLVGVQARVETRQITLLINLASE